jgi:hypothetical protein
LDWRRVSNTTPPLGTIVSAVDPTYGTGEFIFLKGVASTVVGSLVTYDQTLATTTLAPATGGNGPVAVAMSANVASQYGWYQIAGAAAVKAPNAMVVGPMCSCWRRRRAAWTTLRLPASRC